MSLSSPQFIPPPTSSSTKKTPRLAHRPLVDDNMSSLLIAVLPVSIQSRIPRIPSIRRSVNLQTALFGSDASPPTLTAGADAGMSSTSTTPNSSRPSTSYTESIVFSTADSSADEQPNVRKRGRDTAKPSLRRKRSAWTNGSDPAGLDIVLASKGSRDNAADPSQVNWKYGQNGFRTLENALREAGDPERLPELERQIYVESVAYLLRGLPSDLHDGELHQLRDAAPEHLVDDSMGSSLVAQTSSSAYPAHASGRRSRLAIEAPPGKGGADVDQRTLAHTATHWVVTTFYSFIMLLIPIVAGITRFVIDLDRKHHVPEVVFNWFAGVFFLLYQYGVELFVAFRALGDGKVGEAIDEGGVYLANGVSSGFREAVADVAQGKVR